MASVRAPVLPAAASVLSKPAAAPSTSSSTLSYLAAATPAFSWPLVALGAAVGGIAVAGLVLWQRNTTVVNGSKQPTHKLKLVYFNGRGRAEYIRIALALKGVPYEDVRVDHEEFAKLKAAGTLPYQQLPVLECDGVILAQSHAIMRFVCSEYGLYGSSTQEQAQIDVICEGWLEVWQKFSQAKSSPKDVQADNLEIFRNETIPQWLGYLNVLLAKNKGGHGFFFGNNVSCADILGYLVCDHLWNQFIDEFNKFPLLLAHYSRFQKIPEVANWLAKRPDTVY